MRGPRTWAVSALSGGSGGDLTPSGRPEPVARPTAQEDADTRSDEEAAMTDDADADADRETFEHHRDVSHEIQDAPATPCWPRGSAPTTARSPSGCGSS